MLRSVSDTENSWCKICETRRFSETLLIQQIFRLNRKLLSMNFRYSRTVSSPDKNCCNNKDKKFDPTMNILENKFDVAINFSHTNIGEMSCVNKNYARNALLSLEDLRVFITFLNSGYQSARSVWLTIDWNEQLPRWRRGFIGKRVALRRA